MNKRTRREFLRDINLIAAGGFALSAGCATWGKPMQTKRPNFLIIIDDQHSPRAMGWTGETQVITPCIDKLASEGVCFTNAYSNNPVCAPARHSLYTGLYASGHGVVSNDRAMREDIPTMMALLNDGGYTTANIGKMHNGPYHHRRDFQYCLNHEFFDNASGISHYAPYLKGELAKRGMKPGPNWSTPAPGFKSWVDDKDCWAGTHWLPEDLTPERWIADESIKFMKDQKENRPGQPFLLHASFFPPHHPYRPIEKYAKMYDQKEMKLPPNYSPDKAKNAKPANMSEEDAKRFIACYFGFVTQLDAEIGRLLDGLEELGYADNTVVIFLSDHGDLIAEHGRWTKGSMLEGSVRVPFIVRWPGVPPRKESRLISQVDIAPTVLRAAGAEAPGNLPGDDLRSLLENDPGWPDRAIYSEFSPSLPFLYLMLRKGPFKLIATRKSPDGSKVGYELYNVDEDTWEMNDLSEIPEHKNTFDEMKEALAGIWAEQSKNMPKKMPPVVKRSKYIIKWPADPWAPVVPVGPEK